MPGAACRDEAMQWCARALVGGAVLLLLGVAPARPPAAHAGADKDIYFGRTITDPYRWMEEPSSELDTWTRAQDAYTRKVLASIPGRDGLRRHMDDLTGRLTIVTAVTPVGARIFYSRKDPQSDLAKLVVRNRETGRDRVLLDPNTMRQDGRHVAIDQFQPAQDGRFVTVGISAAGSEEDVLSVLDADSGQRLPDTIDRARFAAPSWLPDGTSFFYNRLRKPGLHEAAAARFNGQKVFVHRIGGDADRDPAVFGAGVAGITTIAPSDSVAVAAIIGSRYALGIQNDGVSPELSLYLAKLPAEGGSYSWTRIVTADDGIVDVAAGRETLYFRSHKDAPRYKIISVPLVAPDLRHATMVMPQQDGVLTNIAVSADALYVAERTGAVSALMRIGGDGKAVTLKLPFAGSIAPPDEGRGSLTADPRVAGAIVGIDTWVTPTAFFSIDSAALGSPPVSPAASGATAGPEGPKDVTPLGLAPASAVPDSYVITETTVPAKDGRTRLPLSIIERRGTPHDHNQPVLVEGYGAYGLSEEPFPRFVPVVRGWVDAGGVMAIAHVRGGGELGEDWHLAGKKATKQNTIHDFIDCAWAMTQLGYASPATLAGTGTSAGGITIGGAITQLPSLFRAALIRVGATDPLREEYTEGGPANIPEFGTVKLQADFNALLAMDAYQHVKPGVPYPAVMLTGGAQDHRVPLWEPAKMAARLQAAGARAKGPTLLRVDYEGGHGTIGAGQKQANAEWADGFAFLLWQMGMQGYQPAR